MSRPDERERATELLAQLHHEMDTDNRVLKGLADRGDDPALPHAAIPTTRLFGSPCPVEIRPKVMSRSCGCAGSDDEERSRHPKITPATISTRIKVPELYLVLDGL